jgi:hypothetical protein
MSTICMVAWGAIDIQRLPETHPFALRDLEQQVREEAAGFGFKLSAATTSLRIYRVALAGVDPPDLKIDQFTYGPLDGVCSWLAKRCYPAGNTGEEQIKSGM